MLRHFLSTNIPGPSQNKAWSHKKGNILLKTDKNQCTLSEILKLVSIFKSFSETGQQANRSIENKTTFLKTPPGVDPSSRLLSGERENSPTPEIYTPLKPTGVLKNEAQENLVFS